jgi:uncharacterized CHY-type Zn-finger protein
MMPIAKPKKIYKCYSCGVEYESIGIVRLQHWKNKWASMSLCRGCVKEAYQELFGIVISHENKNVRND